MKRITSIKLSAAALSAFGIFTLSPGIFAGVVEPEERPEKQEKVIAEEAQKAVAQQLLFKLPLSEPQATLSRRMPVPTPQYQAEFAKSRDSSGFLGFVLMKQGEIGKGKSKSTTPAASGIGYYDPATKNVYLKDDAKKVYVLAEKHPLVIEETAKRKTASAKIRKLIESDRQNLKQSTQEHQKGE